MIVMKFGGTSVANLDRIDRVVDIVRSHEDRKPILVVSAHGGVTDMLESEANRVSEGEEPGDRIRKRHMDILEQMDDEELTETVEGLLDELDVLLRGISMVKELTPRTLDYVLSFGERISTRTVAARLRENGVNAKAFDAYDLGMITDSNFGQASPLPTAATKIRDHLEDLDTIPVITGFIGKNREGDVTTLGRNGSDYTASFVGAAVGVDEIQLWSDVSGVMTSAPSLVENAQSIDQMSFPEASELAYYGGRIHPSTLVPAVKQNIPIRMLNTFDPESNGTVIVESCEPKRDVTSIVCKEGIHLIDISTTHMLQRPGFMEKIFEVFGRHDVVIDMISTSEVSVSCTTDSRKNLDRAREELSEFAEVSIFPNRAIVCIVGEGMKASNSVNDRVFDTLRTEEIEPQMITQGKRRINLSLIVDEEEMEKTVRALHSSFFGKNT